MKTDRVRGKTIQWTFSDEPMAKKTFEHGFQKNGAVKFRALDGNSKGKMTRVKKYEVSQDTIPRKHRGEFWQKGLIVQHGTFKVPKGKTKA